MIERFVQFHWELYRNDSRYIPQLDAELVGNKLFKIKGLLTNEHPFNKKADVLYFMAIEENKVKGRIAACDNKVFNSAQEKHTIFFGFFESKNEERIAHALLNEVIEWGKKRGAERVLGPVNFDTTDNMGMLIEGFDRHHYLMTVWNFPYYQNLVESFNYNEKRFTKAMDLLAQEMPVQTPDGLKEKRERLGRVVEEIKKRRDIRIERITLDNLDAAVSIIMEIYNSAWEKNYGFAPITNEDAEMLKANLEVIVNQSVLLIAYVKDEPAAFFGALADINEMIERKGNILDLEILRFLRILYRRNKVKHIRLFAFGIVDKFRKIGVDTAIYYEGFRIGQTMKNFEKCEISWLLETNTLVIRAGESMGAEITKKWRVFELII